MGQADKITSCPVPWQDFELVSLSLCPGTNEGQMSLCSTKQEKERKICWKCYCELDSGYGLGGSLTNRGLHGRKYETVKTKKGGKLHQILFPTKDKSYLKTGRKFKVWVMSFLNRSTNMRIKTYLLLSKFYWTTYESHPASLHAWWLVSPQYFFFIKEYKKEIPMIIIDTFG